MYMFFFQAEDGIRDLVRSRGLGDVYKRQGCCDDHYDVWQGVLTDTTTIEYRVMEFGGGSYGLIDLVELSLVASATSTFIPCYNGTSTVTISASGGFPPYSGTGTFTVSAGTVSYTHLRAHETVLELVCRLLLEKKKNYKSNQF